MLEGLVNDGHKRREGQGLPCCRGRMKPRSELGPARQPPKTTPEQANFTLHQGDQGAGAVRELAALSLAPAVVGVAALLAGSPLDLSRGNLDGKQLPRLWRMTQQEPFTRSKQPNASTPRAGFRKWHRAWLAVRTNFVQLRFLV